MAGDLFWFLFLQLVLKLFFLLVIQKGNPTFRRTSAGELDVQPSQEALIRKTHMQSRVVPEKSAQEVEAEAENRVRSEGGCTEGDGSTVLVLSRYTLQFGMYRGQTFKWLLENDLQYAAFIITDHDEGPRNGRQNHLTSGPLMDNKVHFLSHVCSHWRY